MLRPKLFCLSIASAELKSRFGPVLASSSLSDLTFINATSSAQANRFNTSAYYDSLRTKTFGRTLLYADTMPSTQQLLQTPSLHDLPTGTVCLTRTQDAGRGRGKNTWTSPLGGLCFSIKLQITEGTLLPYIQYLVAISVVESMSAYFQQHTSKISPWSLKIKWPNDIYAVNQNESYKIGGILCQSSYMTDVFDVVVGIGLNLFNTAPTVCLQSMFEAEIKEEDYEAVQDVLLAEFLNHFETHYILFLQQGFHPFQSTYLQLWMHSNQKIYLQEEKTSAMITGLAPSGFLEAKDVNGRIYELHPDGNSFDMTTLTVYTKK